MKRLKFYFFLGLILIVSATGAPLRAMDFYRARKGEILFTDEYVDKLTKKLKTAQNEILVWQYLVMGRGYVPRVQKILDVLKKKALKGVRVKMFLDSSREDDYGNAINAHLKTYFGTAPVRVNLVSNDKVMHNKVVIIDREKVFVGSQNWTKSGLKKNIELAMYIKNKKLGWKLRKKLRESLTPRETKKIFKPGQEDINTVSRKQLLSLPTLGPHFVDKIIEYRRAKGTIRVEELKNIEGIGKKRLEILHEYLGR